MQWPVRLNVLLFVLRFSVEVVYSEEKANQNTVSNSLLYSHFSGFVIVRGKYITGDPSAQRGEAAAAARPQVQPVGG